MLGLVACAGGGDIKAAVTVTRVTLDDTSCRRNCPGSVIYEVTAEEENGCEGTDVEVKWTQWLSDASDEGVRQSYSLKSVLSLHVVCPT